MIQFQKATKKGARLRMALIGPSGSGKTYSALNIAKYLGEKIALIDTERGSASKYADFFDFDTLVLDTFSPQTYIDAIHAAEEAGYTVLIIDSLSHAWMGKEGALELVDRAAKRSQSGNTFTAWREVTPLHNALVDAILQSGCHIIATMRAKTEYVIDKDERTGKMTPRKVGLAPIQRDGLEYEFDVVADMDMDNNLIVAKTRCPALNGMVIQKPGKEIAQILLSWLGDSEQPIEQGNGSARAETSFGKHERPYPPHVLRERLLKIREEMSRRGYKAKEGTIGVVAANLEECFAPATDAEHRRHTLTYYLTGYRTLKELDDAWLLALKRWLNPQQDSGGMWAPDPLAVQEANAAYNEAERSLGQMELEIEEL